MNINTGDTQDKQVVYYPSGSAAFAFVGLATTKCDAVMLYFPFDRHSCELNFISMEPIHRVLMVVHDLPHKVPSYENKEWKILSIKKKHSIYHVARNHSMISFSIQFERRPAFYILNILSPLPCLGLTNVLVFALPISSGERVSFSVTILLTLVFFLNMIADRLPPTSEPISLFNVMVMVQLQNSVFIVICTILSMMTYEKAQKNADVPRMLCKIVVFLQNTNKTRGMSSEQEDVSAIPAKTDELKTAQKTSDSSSQITWNEVSDCTERSFSKLFSCMFIVEWIIFLTMMIVGTD
ncbi:acetylcholine receptor subunit delta-like [Saccostrea cucullata]|uniref:acetylcholine receptor subunit delta-like n=1 Tax=Saccostrea cuccullata TaxID=36930 RepID=UPI002ED0EA98